MTEKSNLLLCFSTKDFPNDRAELVAAELRNRGHRVVLRRTLGTMAGSQNFVESAKDLANTAKDAAGAGVQKLLSGFFDLVNASEKDRQNIENAIDDKKNDALIDAVLYVNESDISQSYAPDSALKIALLPQPGLLCEWKTSKFDAVVSCHPDFAPYLLKEGWDEKQIFEGGFAVNNDNLRTDSIENCKSKLGIKQEDGPVVLFLVEDFEYRDLQTLFVQVSLVNTKFQPFFCYGENEQNAQTLRTFARTFKIDAKMFGSVQPMGLYLGMADVIVANNNSRIVSDLAALSQPLLLISNPTPNAISAFLTHKNIASAVGKIIDLKDELSHLLENIDIFVERRQNAIEFSRYGSTALLADAVERALNGAALIKATSKRGQKENVSEFGFESIGQSVSPSRPDFVSPFEAPLRTQASAEEVLSAVLESTTEEPRSFDAIQREYTVLILSQKDVERELDKIAEKVRGYEKLIPEKLDAEQSEELNKNLEKARAREMALYKQLDEINAQKLQLKGLSTRFKSPSSKRQDRDFEEEFRKLQNEADLRDLKNRMK